MLHNVISSKEVRVLRHQVLQEAGGAAELSKGTLYTNDVTGSGLEWCEWFPLVINIII